MPARSRARCLTNWARSSLARPIWSSGWPSGCWPTATSCSKACRACQNPGGQIARQLHPRQIFSLQFTPDMLPADVIGTQITTRSPAASRRAKADLRQPRPRRRNQPRAGQGAKRAARSDAGKAGHHRRADVQAGRTFLVLATQNPIEHEHVSAARGAGGPFHVKLKIGYRRAPRNAKSSTHGAHVRHAGHQPRRGPAADSQSPRSHQRHLRGRQGEGLHRGPGLRDARSEQYKIQVKDFIQLGASPRATIYLTLAPRRSPSSRPRLRHPADVKKHRMTCCATAWPSPTKPKPRRRPANGHPENLR